MRIAYVKREEINTEKWNQFLDQKEQGLIYANANYLDLLAPRWDALILGNYEAVMPLPYKKKFGIRYLTPPPFVQQLGIIGGEGKDMYRHFLEAAKKRFPKASLHLNFANHLEGTEACNNFVLDLHRSYAEISSGFTYYLRKQTRENEKPELEYRLSTSFRQVTALYRAYYGQRFPHVPERSYSGLVEFAEKYTSHALVREVWRNNELLSAVLCLRDNKRIYLVVSVVTEDGQKAEANRFLLDQLIREHAGMPLLLDFEGSDLPGVAAYYKGFGAINQPYYRLEWTSPFLKVIGY